MAFPAPVQTAVSSLYGNAITFGSSITGGNGLVLMVSVTGGTITSVSGGDTWTTLTLVSNYLYCCYVPASASGGYTAITVSSGATVIGVAAFEVPGQIVLDTSAGAGAGPSSSWSSGSAATTTSASEIWIGAIQSNQYVATGPASYTYLALIGSSGGNMLAAGYYVASAAGIPLFSGSFPSGDTDYYSAGVVAFKPSSVTYAGTAALYGQGSLSLTPAKLFTASLAGRGGFTVSPLIAVPGAGTLYGQGSLSVAPQALVPGSGNANLYGQGALSGGWDATWAQSVALAGEGSLSALETGQSQYTAVLYGQGALGFAVTLGLGAALTGAGTLSVPQVSGGLLAGTGGAATPQALAGTSQVAVAPQGSGNWQWLGTLGQVTALTYSYVCPGGCDKMQMTLMVPASYRTQMFNPGWKVKITRGGHDVWHGILDEPQPSAQGWTLTAVGNGNLGTNYVSFYSIFDVWPQDEPDEIINRAIGRGLPWVNTGLASSPYFSQFWFGQATDPASQTVTAFLNLICTRGGLLWYVSSQPGGTYGGDELSVFPLPVTASRLLVCTTPVARTLGGYVNTIFARYMLSADNTTTNVPAAYQVNEARNLPSIAAHGPLETYIDLSNAGVMTAAQVNTLCSAIFAAYEAASFAGPFTASYGQLMNSGGAPVDPGTDQAGTRVRLILTDLGYGGEVVPGPVEFTVGAYSWDDFAQVATITPLQTLDESLSGMLSAWNTVSTPVTTAGA